MFFCKNESANLFKCFLSIIIIVSVNSHDLEDAEYCKSEEKDILRSLMSNGYFSISIREKLLWQIFYSIIGSILVGLSGVLPLLVISADTGIYLRSKVGMRALNRWLSFAFGSIIGDVFVHLLPEAWANIRDEDHNHNSDIFLGVWVIIGFLLFLIIEKIFVDQSLEQQFGDDALRKGKEIDDVIKTSEIQAEGYLNLLANFIDNFTHGLAVGGSFLISFKIGVLTTICILVHEIPHEVTDFVILLRAGFDRWKAAKLQFLTAGGSLFGAIFALTADANTTGRSKNWILPLTSGAFIYIAMVSLLPAILSELSLRESFIQLSLVIMGFITMVTLSHHCG